MYIILQNLIMAPSTEVWYSKYLVMCCCLAVLGVGYMIWSWLNRVFLR